MRRLRIQTLYWILAAAFLGGALLAAKDSDWVGTGYGHPHQGLSVALGVLSATFVFLADRARRDEDRRNSE